LKPCLIAENEAARAAPEDGSLAGDHAHRELPQPVIDPNILANRLDRAGTRVAPGRRAAGQSAPHQVFLDLCRAEGYVEHFHGKRDPPARRRELLHIMSRAIHQTEQSPAGLELTTPITEAITRQCVMGA